MNYEWRTDVVEDYEKPSQKLDDHIDAACRRWGFPLRKTQTTQDKQQVIMARLTKIEEGISKFIKREQVAAERKRTAAKQERLAKIKEMVDLAGERVMQNASKPERANIVSVETPGMARFLELAGKVGAQ
jgi:hypothetical protein